MTLKINEVEYDGGRCRALLLAEGGGGEGQGQMTMSEKVEVRELGAVTTIRRRGSTDRCIIHS